MLVNLNELLSQAIKNKYAIAAFNVFGYEDAKAVIEVAEQLEKSVILLSNKASIEHIPVESLGPMYSNMASQAKVKVCVHLDHCQKEPLIKRAISSGYSSVMFDGSQFSLEQNIDRTKKIASWAHSHGVSIEGEVGEIPTKSVDNSLPEYSNPADVALFAKETAVDAVAISIGNIHRQTTKNAVINYKVLSSIEQETKVPLVIHGTSSIPAEDIKTLSRRQVAKFNIGTCVRQAFTRSLRYHLGNEPSQFDRIYFFKKVMEDIKPVISEQILSLCE